MQDKIYNRGSNKKEIKFFLLKLAKFQDSAVDVYNTYNNETL